MRILVNGAPHSVVRSVGAQVYGDHLGCLTGPRSWYDPSTSMDYGSPWAADNDCYNGLDRDAYIRMLRRLQGKPGCLFVTVPDIVGNAATTLARFRLWAPTVRYFGYPLAFVIQDGQEDLPVPWNDFDVMFIGGTTAWKLGRHAAALAHGAIQRGKAVHMGRVNSIRRILYARALGCATVDGTGFSRYKKNITPHIPALTQPFNLTYMGELA